MPEVLMVVTVAWGVLAFGAVYPWAYWPLLAAAAGTGVWCLLTTRAGRSTTSLSVAFAIVGLVIACQLVPLPSRVLDLLSPAADQLLRNYSFGYSSHALSIEP